MLKNRFEAQQQIELEKKQAEIKKKAEDEKARRNAKAIEDAKKKVDRNAELEHKKTKTKRRRPAGGARGQRIVRQPPVNQDENAVIDPLEEQRIADEQEKKLIQSFLPLL